MSDEDLQNTDTERPALEVEGADDLTDTVVTGMPAFQLPPDLADMGETEAGGDEPGPEDTDETMADDGFDDDEPTGS